VQNVIGVASCAVPSIVCAHAKHSVANVTEDLDPRSGELGITWVGKSVAEADSALDLALQLLERVEGIIVDVDREIVHWDWVD